MSRLPRGLFWILNVGLLALVATTITRLPPVVASHFDARGVPNGWSSRAGYGVLLVVIGTALPLGITWLAATLTRGGGLERMNVPWRDYWQQPAHVAEGVRRVRGHMWWLACVLTATAIAIHWLILEAHTHQPPRLSSSGIALVLVAVPLAIGLWVAALYWLLRPPIR